MYEILINEATKDLDLSWQDEKKERLSEFLSMYDKNLICELYEALQKIKNGSLETYGFSLEPFTHVINPETARVMYNDGMDTSDDTYSFHEFEEMLELYCDEYEKAYDINLREVSEGYEPIIEGIIDESNVINDTRVKRF